MLGGRSCVPENVRKANRKYPVTVSSTAATFDFDETQVFHETDTALRGAHSVYPLDLCGGTNTPDQDRQTLQAAINSPGIPLIVFCQGNKTFHIKGIDLVCLVRPK